MNVLVFFALFFGAMFLIPWLFKKFANTENGRQESEQAHQRPIPPRRRHRKIKSQNRSLRPEDEFPHWNPLYNDEIDWKTKAEPNYRKHVDYPPDWQRRRALAFIKDQGKCQKCGKACGHLACDPNQIWNFKFNEQLLYDADVHHAKHKSSGGDHSLDNLLLYCLLCHSREHPENSHIGARRALKGLGGGGSKQLFPRKAPKPPDEDMPF
jgi:hypothetical protein